MAHDILNRNLAMVHMGVLNQILDAPVTQDGPQLWYVPESSAHFSQLGITAPGYIYPCQEASGNLLNVGSAGTASLVPGYTSTPPTYQNTVSGWTRKGVGCIDSDANNGFRMASGTGWNPGSNSVAMLGYFSLESVAATNRNIMAISQGSGADDNSALTIASAADGKIKNYCDGGTSSGVYDLIPSTVAILTVYDRTNSSFVTYVTATTGVGRRIVGQYFATVVDGSKGLGAPPIEPTTYSVEMKCFALYAWEGAAAEMTRSQVHTLFDNLNIDRPFTVDSDGPNHIYLPTTTDDYSFLGITAPTSTHGYQEAGASDDALDLIGTGFNLADGTALTQNNSITESGWATQTGVGARKCWEFTHNNGNSSASAAAGTGPNVSNQSVLAMGLVDVVTAGTSTTRSLLQLGGATAGAEVALQVITDGAGASKLRLKCAGVGVTGTVDIKTPVVMTLVGVVYDRNASVCCAFSLDEWITGTYSGSTTDGNKGWGISPNLSPAGFQLTWDEWTYGAAAQLGANETAIKNAIRSRLQAMGHTVAW